MADETTGKTIEDLLVAVTDTTAAVDADLKAQAELNAKTKADMDAKSSATTALATGIVEVGDFFKLNPDGTATAYFDSNTAADGYYSVILKPASTPVGSTTIDTGNGNGTDTGNGNGTDSGVGAVGDPGTGTDTGTGTGTGQPAAAQESAFVHDYSHRSPPQV